MGERIKSHEWGWTITDTQMQLKYTDLGYAPDELLSQIHCKCRTNFDIMLQMQKAESTQLFVPLSVVVKNIQILKTASDNSMYI